MLSGSEHGLAAELHFGGALLGGGKRGLRGGFDFLAGVGVLGMRPRQKNRALAASVRRESRARMDKVRF